MPSLCVKITFIQNVNFHIKFIVFGFLVSYMVALFPIAIKGVAINVVVLRLIAIEGIHWARDGPKFVCEVDWCDVSYIAKYNLVQHLWAHHNVARFQDHATMNAKVLSNLLA